MISIGLIGKVAVIKILHECGFSFTQVTIYNNRVHLDDVYVSPSYRRKGYGSMMLREVDKIAADRGLKIVGEIVDHNLEMSDENLIKFYTKNGYTVKYKRLEKIKITLSGEYAVMVDELK